MDVSKRREGLGFVTMRIIDVVVFQGFPRYDDARAQTVHLLSGGGVPCLG